LARLTFQNVPTKSGGVVSGNISTGAGSPFGAGGKYEAQVAGIKAEIAKKPVGYYDPPPMTLWKDTNPRIEAETRSDPAVKKANEILGNLRSQESYCKIHRGKTQCRDMFGLQFKIAQQLKIISDIRERVTAEKNAPVILAQQEQQAREADLIRKLEIELAVQRVLDKQVINQRPTPTAPEITTSPTSYLPLAVVGIVIVVILLFLRRRA